MPQFTLPNIQNGGSITVNATDLASAQQAAANQTGVSLGAQQAGGTFGANTFGGGGGGAGGDPTASTNGSLAALQQFAAQTSGVTQQQLAQQKAEFDAQLQFAKDQMTQLGIPQLQINQFLAQLQQEQFQSQLALAQQAQAYNQAATTASLTGYYTPPAAVPNVSGYTNQAVWQPGQQFQAGSLGTAPGAGGASTYAPGTFVMNRDNGQIGQIQADGTLKVFSTWQEYLNAGGQANAQGVATGVTSLPGAQYAQVAAVQPAAPAAAAAPFGAAGQPGTTGQPGQPAGSQMTMQLGQLLGEYNGMPTEAAREFNQNLALQQGQLGQQYLATAAQLQGPQNTFQLSNYLRGAQANQAVPTYLQNLASNISTPMFQGAGSTAPTPQSAAGLASQLGGTSSATPGWDYNQTLGAIQNIMSGAQKLAPGSIEQLTPDELQALGSGLGAAGGSLPSFMAQYASSRVGQQAPVAQTSLA